MSVAVLDIGKTNVKFVVFDEGGHTLFERQTSNDVIDVPPYPHFDVDRIWSFLGVSLREATQKFEIETLVPTTHGASGCIMNDDGLALPIMDYEFKGIESISERYNKIRDPFSKTFSPSLTVGLNLGRQIAYAAWNNPTEYDNSTNIITYPQYWVWRLTGVFASDICSIGTHTDLWLPLENKPSQLADELGVTKRLVKMIPPWQVIGQIVPPVAKEWGITSKIKVLCGIHDSNASLLPYLSSRQVPFTLLSSGTWVIIMAVGHSLETLDSTLDMLANIDAYGRPIACANFMGGREYAAIAGDCTDAPSLKVISTLINSEIYALPSFSPGGGPFANRRGEFIGELKPEYRTSMATLYCALMCVKRLEDLGVHQGDLIVDGNFAQNEILCGLIAALQPDQKLFAAKDHSGTARGAAMLASWGKSHAAPETKLIAAARVDGLKDYYAKWKSLIS